MFNMNEPFDAKWLYDNKKQGFVMTAVRSIEANSEIFVHYGQKSIYKSILNYAFIFDYDQEIKDKLDFTYVTMDLDYEDDFLTNKLEHVIDYGKGTEQKFELYLDFFHHQSNLDLLSWARFVSFDLHYDILEHKLLQATNRFTQKLKSLDKGDYNFTTQYAFDVIPKPISLENER